MTPFESGFIRHSPRYPHVLAYMREALQVREITYADINVSNLLIIRDHMLTKVTANTARNYCAVLLAHINLLAEDGIIPRKDYAKAMRIKKTPSDQVYLTADEMQRIEAYYWQLLKKAGHTAEKSVLNLFLIEYYTGMRTIDTEHVSEANISNGQLAYVSQKTKQKSILPAHAKLARLLELKSDKHYCASTKSRAIQRAAKRCGICQPVTLFLRGETRTIPKYEAISTHTARRSFATQLALNGAPITEICQFMNHQQNINQTMRYIIADNSHTSAEAMAFFNGQ